MKKSVLLKTSSANDVAENGNVVSITGLVPIAKNSIANITQFKYHAEVVQVLTFTTTSETPLASTTYQLTYTNPNVRKYGYTQNTWTYSYTTPATITDIGATAALQREYINGKLIAEINAQTTLNYTTAATIANGDGITITDSAGYYPPRLQNATGGRKGATNVTITDGFTNAATVVTVATSPVYQFGDGTWLSQNAPIYSPYFQNFISGQVDTPLTNANPGVPATAGQFYDAFAITSYVISPNSSLIQGQLCLIQQDQIVFVDNGTGSSTANLAGFIAFQRAMMTIMFSLYKTNKGTLYSMFNNGISYATLTGLSVIPTTALAEYIINLGDGQTMSGTPSVVATSAAVAAARIDATNGGLNLAIDAANGKATEVSAHLDTHMDKQFIVGQGTFSMYARIYVDDVSGVDPMVMGFRKKAAYAAALATNTDYATIGLIGAAGDIKSGTQVASGGQVTTDTTLNWADAETHELEVRVASTGVVTWYVDGQQVNKTTTYTFTAGLTVIPFVSELQTADVAANVSVIQFAALPTASWRV